jgi:hypothetical protein
MRFSDFLLVSDPGDLDFIVGYTEEQNIRISVSDFFGNQIFGSGNPGYIPVFTGTQTLGNSQIFQDGSNIVIGGVNAMGYRLAVGGSLYTANGAVINSTVSGADALRVIGGDGDIFVIPNDLGQSISSLRRIIHPPAVLTTESATLGQVNSAILNLENEIDILLDLKVDKTSIGVPNGVASLDSGGKIPLSQIPDSIIGQVQYMGTWNAFTNTPTLNPLIPEERGHYYVVSAAGVFGGVDYQIGDWIISNGVIWEKVDNTDAVTSVFGRIGAILALEGDYQSFYPRLSQAYDNPTWINTLAFTKITGVPPFLLENQTITLSGDVTGSGKTSISTTISNNAVSNEKLRDSVGTSVIGRSASTTGDPADIQATTDGHVLLRSAGNLLFGLISGDSISSINWSKITGTPTTLSGYGITDAYTKTEADNKFVPYTGANANVNLGSNNITANSFIKAGGTSSQFLKADGSVDTSQYVPTTRSVNAGTGLTGGGNLSSDITIAFDTTWGDNRYAYRTRQLTINGVTYDLSADRTWSVGTVNTLTTIGTSGPATLVGNTLNIPQYTDQFVGTVTSVGLSMPNAFTVSNSPITSSGTLTVVGAGTAAQYVRGDGTLGDFPSGGGGGGSSVSYYLNGSINQGTFAGNTYYEMSKVPVFGAGTDFNIATNGYISQFITDANDPESLLIPAGNWNFELYFSSSSSGGTPSFYVELYKYDGTTFTLIADNSANPEFIAFGTTINPYFSPLAVPETVLAVTDRLAIRVYVNNSGKTITLHTENSHLCQVITTFTTGLTALNGLTKQVQYLTTGTSGTDFNIASSVATHTFNLPTATSTIRGALSSADWITFNGKQNAITLTTTGTTGSATLIGSTLNIPNYSTDLSGYVTLATDQTITGLKTIMRVGAAIDVLNFKIDTSNIYALKVAYNQNELAPAGEATWSFANTFNNGTGTGLTTTPISFFRGVLVTGERLLSASVNTNLLNYYASNPTGRYPIYAYNTGVQQFASSIIVGETNGVVDAITGAIADLPSGVVANFKGRVIGSNAVNNNEFATLGQVTSTSRASISLTTTGTSGPATYSSVTGVLNIPEYQGGVTSFNTRTGAVTLTSSDVTTALGYTPVTDARTLSINGVTYDLTANRSWTVGVNPSAREIQTYIATASQTTFTVTGGYTVGLVDVFINGVRLTSSDYTATNGTTVVLTVGTMAGNIVDIIKYTSGIVNSISGTGTTNELAYFTASTTIASLSTATYPSLTELSYVKGVTSSIQTQLNGKQNALTNPVTGTGTTNYLPKFTGSTTIGNSQVIDNGTQVGVGQNPNASYATLQIKTPSSSYSLDLVGRTAGLNGENQITFWNAAQSSVLASIGNLSSNLYLSTGTNQPFTLSSGGNFIFGSSSDNGAIMQINDSASGSTKTFTRYTCGDGGDIRVGKESGINNDAIFGTWSNNSVVFYANSAEAMRITNGRNVEIGTYSFTSPSGADRFVGVYGAQDCSLILQDNVQLWELYVNDDFYINRGSTNVLTLNRSSGAATFNGNMNQNINDGALNFYKSDGTTLKAFIGNLNSTTTDEGYLGLYKTNVQKVAIRASGTSYLDGGNVLIGTTTDAGFKLDVNGTGRFSDGTQGLIIRAYTGTDGWGAIYPVGVTPSGTNYSLIARSTNAVLNASTSVTLAVGDSGRLTANSTGIFVTGTFTFTSSVQLSGSFQSSGTTPYWQFQSTGAGGTGYLGFGASLSSGAAATDFIIRSDNALKFATQGTVALSINSAGNVLIGTTTDNGYKLRVNGDIWVDGIYRVPVSSYFICGSAGYRFNNSTDAFNNFVALDNGNATLRGTLTQNASDERLKNNIEIIPNAIDKIKQLRGVTFKWNQELYETSRTFDIGVIAQEVEKVLPNAVCLAPFDTNFDDNTSKSGQNYLTVYYDKLIPLLIEGIKELKAELDELKSKN